MKRTACARNCAAVMSDYDDLPPSSGRRRWKVEWQLCAPITFATTVSLIAIVLASATFADRDAAFADRDAARDAAAADTVLRAHAAGASAAEFLRSPVCTSSAPHFTATFGSLELRHAACVPIANYFRYVALTDEKTAIQTGQFDHFGFDHAVEGAARDTHFFTIMRTRGPDDSGVSDNVDASRRVDASLRRDVSSLLDAADPVYTAIVHPTGTLDVHLREGDGSGRGALLVVTYDPSTTHGIEAVGEDSGSKRRRLAPLSLVAHPKRRKSPKGNMTLVMQKRRPAPGGYDSIMPERGPTTAFLPTAHLVNVKGTKMTKTKTTAGY